MSTSQKKLVYETSLKWFDELDEKTRDELFYEFANTYTFMLEAYREGDTDKKRLLFASILSNASVLKPSAVFSPCGNEPARQRKLRRK